MSATAGFGAARARCAAMARLVAMPRGARFARRCAGRSPARFDTTVQLPDWLLADGAMQERVAILAALLHHRRAIDAELSGPRLARLAQAAGEPLFDAACEVEVGFRGGPAVLPAPDTLVVSGRSLMEAALPSCLRDRFAGARDDARARQIVATAWHIAKALA